MQEPKGRCRWGYGSRGDIQIRKESEARNGGGSKGGNGGNSDNGVNG